MPSFSASNLLKSIAIGAIFGGLTFGILELAIQWLLNTYYTWEGSIMNCPGPLWDVQQLWISIGTALCAGGGLYFRFFDQKKSFDQFETIFLLSYLALIPYGLRIILYVLSYSECSALYSPGIVKMFPFGLVGGGLRLMIEIGQIALVMSLFLFTTFHLGGYLIKIKPREKLKKEKTSKVGPILMWLSFILYFYLRGLYWNDQYPLLMEVAFGLRLILVLIVPVYITIWIIKKLVQLR